MAESKLTFDQVNLVVRDMDASVAFYRRLGLKISDGPEWPPGSGARHAEATISGGIRLELDNYEMVKIWHPSWRPGDAGSRAVLGFSLQSREAVDERYVALSTAGYAGRESPHDAFWGARYAIVLDPDSNDVGLMSPIDAAKRFTPKT